PTRPGDERPDLLVAEVREGRPDAFKERKDELGLLGLMPQVVTPKDLFGDRVDDHSLDGRRADVDADRNRFSPRIHRVFSSHAYSLARDLKKENQEID